MLFDLPTDEYRLEDKIFIKKIEKTENKKTIDINKLGLFLEVDLDSWY